MDCNETRRLLDADIDGELDLVRHLELEAHLRSCPTCGQLAENARARRAARREALPRFTAPPHLADKIRAALPTPRALPPPPARIIFPLWQLAGLAASIAFAVLVGYSWGTARGRANALFDEAIANHVRSLQVDHLTDVVSSDQHTVKPWFAGKLDFSPPVVDLASAGFVLAGGRLEQLDGRPAASLVFHRRQHAINLFIWSAGNAPLSTRAMQRHGYNATTWSRGGLNFIAVSDIPERELAQFADTFRNTAQ